MSVPSMRDPAGAFGDGSGDRAQRGRLADTVTAKQRHRLALVDDEVQPVEHRAAAVTTAHAFQQQQRFRVLAHRAAIDTRRDRFARRAEIGGDDLGIARDIGRFAVGDDAPLVQHRDPVGQRQHAVDVVLDQQHRVRRRQFPDQRADHLAIGLGEAGQRFVQQQQFRVGGERDGDFQQPFLAMREVGARFGGSLVQADIGEQRPGAGVDRLQLRKRRAIDRGARRLCACTATRTFSNVVRLGKTLRI